MSNQKTEKSPENTIEEKSKAQPKIRKITIKTAVRAAGQSHNRYKFSQ